MPDYGLTSKGPNIKRLDVILDEMHSDLSDKLQVNTRQNPQSLLNHVLTNISDRIAELWEFGQDVYYSQYPSSAEKNDLDNAVQYGGITRTPAKQSVYSVLCTGTDGTAIPAGTTLRSTTNPETDLILMNSATISRSACSALKIKLTVDTVTTTVSVVIDGTGYHYTPQSGDDALDILTGLKTQIVDSAFTTAVDETNVLLSIAAVDETSSHDFVLSDTLTTEQVSSVISFSTVEYGDIYLPNGAITKIVKAVTGLDSVVNVGEYIAGNLAETDSELRKSYVDKIYARSSRMIESIRSAILSDVQGVSSVVGYENDTNNIDSSGRGPHSIEFVVDGGDQKAIAEKILETKAAGITTYGSVTVSVTGLYGEDITIKFSRPTSKYIWMKVQLTLSENASLPSNYSERIKEILLEYIESLNAGDTVVPQKTVGEIHDYVTGIDYVDIQLYATTDVTSEEPTSYPLRTITCSERERATSDAAKIEVVIDG